MTSLYKQSNYNHSPALFWSIFSFMTIRCSFFFGLWWVCFLCMCCLFVLWGFFNYFFLVVFVFQQNQQNQQNQQKSVTIRKNAQLSEESHEKVLFQQHTVMITLGRLKHLFMMERARLFIPAIKYLKQICSQHTTKQMRLQSNLLLSFKYMILFGNVIPLK